MVIAITGATSMIGIATIKACVENDIDVVAFTRKNSSNIGRLDKFKNIQIIECDLQNMYLLSKKKIKADVFIHFAWAFTQKTERDDASKQYKNIEYTLEAVRLASRLGCERFIGVGSQAEYGVPNIILTENIPCNPLVAYGIAKYAAGKFCEIECKKYNLIFNWVRVLSVYGVNDHNKTMLSILINNIKNGTPTNLTSCEQVWDYLFEDDAGTAFVAIARYGKNGRLYNLGSGVGRKLKYFVEDVVNILNPKYKPNFGRISYNQAQPLFLQADITSLSNDTNWSAEVSFSEGIKKMCVEGGGAMMVY